jgi:hypothetical protein
MKKFSLNIQKKFGGMEIKQISWVKKWVLKIKNVDLFIC